MKILAFDLSSGHGSIAFRDAASETFASGFPNDRKHSGFFFEQLQACVRKSGLPDRIAVGLGPGSYAGTRIAIAAALGLRLANQAELIGIASVRAIDTDASDYVLIGDARRNSFYFARVHQRRCVEGPLLCTKEQLRERLAASDLPMFCTEPIDGFGPVAVAYPSASVLAQIAATEEVSITTAPLEPIYLRDAHITQPKAVSAARGR
ncbi:MAG: tRNA (adenosine(37)-N6)-threonylcarbamoyltransferase complex dimerization subunit type 1 TsaB [Chthoniobacterales bacterium]